MALATGVFLGLSCGLAPGPMLALVLAVVLAQTLRHGPREGCKIALKPLFTDTPIILVALALASEVAQLTTMLGLISIGGGIYVMYLAWDSCRPTHLGMEIPMQAPKSWFKGVVTNLLNPHPWLFWLRVGAAILARAMAQGLLEALTFLFGFDLLLVGSKVGLALLAGRSRDLLAGRPYRAMMRVLAGLLAVFALLLLREGLHRIRPGSEMNNIHKRAALDLPWS